MDYRKGQSEDVNNEDGIENCNGKLYNLVKKQFEKEYSVTVIIDDIICKQGEPA